MKIDLTKAETHYEFGANWQEYLLKINDAAIANAEVEFARHVGEHNAAGKTFLDIGSGSGLHSVSAVRQGVKSVVTIDIDRDSVDATRKTMAKYAANADFKPMELSILDDSFRQLGQFDLVYSWGVLHHTGAMWKAIANAAECVAPGGIFALAIYCKTPMCGAWRVEKRIYTNGSKAVRGVIRTAYLTAFRAAFLVTGRNFKDYVDGYSKGRGMNFYTDIEDWLGGYPYESATEQEITDFLVPRGFKLDYVRPAGGSLGLLGTGCSEYRFIRTG